MNYGSTRKTTQEGFMRAGAVITRAGPIVYDRSEIGLDGEGAVTVERTMESLSHPETIASLRGAPITIGHPPGGVTPENFKDVVVGAVAGEPRVVSDQIVGDIFLGDLGGLERLAAGTEELSIGYDFTLNPDGVTKGPIRINHVALVERGRAGSSVRVLDESKESKMPEDMGMQKKELMDALGSAFDMAVSKYDMSHKNMGMDARMAEDMKRSMYDTIDMAMKKMGEDMIKPMQDDLKKMADAQDEAKKAEAVALAKAKAEDAAKQLTDQVRAEERARYQVMTEALPFIPAEKRVGLDAMAEKDILVLAVGDAVPGAANESVDFLRGIIRTMGSRADAAGAPSGQQLPAGVVAFDQSRISNVSDARKTALDKYVEMQAKQYADGGGV